MLAEIELSTARVRKMADDAHALVEQLQHRRTSALVKQWSSSVDASAPPKRKDK
jgi:hypothetical protein